MDTKLVAEIFVCQDAASFLCRIIPYFSFFVYALIYKNIAGKPLEFLGHLLGHGFVIHDRAGAENDNKDTEQAVVRIDVPVCQMADADVQQLIELLLLYKGLLFHRIPQSLSLRDVPQVVALHPEILVMFFHPRLNEVEVFHDIVFQEHQEETALIIVHGSAALLRIDFHGICENFADAICCHLGNKLVLGSQQASIQHFTLGYAFNFSHFFEDVILNNPQGECFFDGLFLFLK